MGGINEFANASKKPILFKTSDTEHVCYTAQTIEYKNSIDITIKGKVSKDKIATIFVHELGEADYLARKNPQVIDKRDRENFNNRIVELFSHPHARKLAIKYDLEQVEGEFRVSQIARLKEKDFLQYTYDWQVVLMICWTCATYPEISEMRTKLIGYTKFKDHIEKFMDVLEMADTFDEVNQVKILMDKVIQILGELGLKDMERSK